jgi:hypothetical protein
VLGREADDLAAADARAGATEAEVRGRRVRAAGRRRRARLRWPRRAGPNEGERFSKTATS